jgi:hypothetical protein
MKKEKAGTKSLEAYFQMQLDEVLLRRLDLSKRLGAQNTLSEEDRSRYYSSWVYAALHMAVTVPELRTREKLMGHLNITEDMFQRAIEFLLKTGLVREQGRGFHPGPSFMRLGKESHQIIKHHTNWRNQAIEALERETPRDLHYAAVLSLSGEDGVRIKDRLLQSIDDNLKIVKASPEEKVFVYVVDFFELKKN